jgi:hypothetical protein
VGMQVRWEGSGTKPAGEYAFFYGKGNKNFKYVQVSLCEGIISAVKRIEFVSDRISHIILRGYYCHICVLNIYPKTEDNVDYVKDCSYE